MGEELSLLSCTVCTFGIQSAVVVVKSGVNLCLHTGDPLIKLLVTLAGVSQLLITGDKVLLLTQVCGQLCLLTHRKSFLLSLGLVFC